MNANPALPPDVEQALSRFTDAARDALGPTLEAVVLYGSAAEGHLRATSDVNLILVLAAFEPARVDALRQALRVARAEFGAQVMFLLHAEIAESAEAFAVKFADLSRRRRVLWGKDVFADLHVSREARLRRVRQELLNQALRLRAEYATLSLREEQLVRALADAAGPLRAAAMTLRELEGKPAAASAREALESLALHEPTWVKALAKMSQAREHGTLEAGAAAPAFLSLLALCGHLRDLARAMA